MDHSKIIDDLGGTAEVAVLCRVSMAAVSQWRKSGIPQAREMYLRVVRPEVFGEPQAMNRRKGDVEVGLG